MKQLALLSLVLLLQVTTANAQQPVASDVILHNGASTPSTATVRPPKPSLSKTASSSPSAPTHRP
jgi:hypothetical protein